MKLNDVKIRNAKPEVKSYKLFDGGGLYIEIMPITNKNPKGSKLWRLKYRYGGKEKRISFGKYPTITLDAARKKREEAKIKLDGEIDPSVARSEEKILKNLSSASTFEAIGREWLEKKKGEVKEKTHKNMTDRLEMNLFPRIGKLPIKSINAPILIEALKPVEKRGALDTLKRLREYSGQIFKFAIAHGKADYNPAADIMGALKTRPVKHFKSMPLGFFSRAKRTVIQYYKY